MSASSKKKLRKEAAAAKLTERQAAEQKEAKKLKTYSIIFAVVISAMLIFALVFGISKTITNNGLVERNTTAATVGNHKISSAELNMFYIDAINSYSQYLTMFGVDTTVPLDQQIYDLETNQTWADYFLEAALNNAKYVYTMCDLAKADGYILSADEQTELTTNLENAESYAILNYGYSDLESYLKAMYGNGCTEKLFSKYQENAALAQSYYNHYPETLSYTDDELHAFEADAYDEYSSYTYNYYTLSVDKFLVGGKTDDDGKLVYSDAEKAAAVVSAEKAAQTLTSDEIITLEDLDAAIAALPMNAEVENAASTACTDQAYSSVSSTIREWLTDDARKEGDLTYIANTSTSTDADGNETTTTNSFIVVMYHSTNDNKFPLVNVRHILVSFEGGTTDENGNTVYSDEEKAAAEAKAKDLLAQFESTDGSSDAFAELAKVNSTDTGSQENGGLYNDVYPGQMVTSFNDWCFDASRKTGDTGLVESSNGWHVMYFEGYSETTYRDYKLTTAMKNEDVTAWYENAMGAVTAQITNDKHIKKDLVLTTG